METIAVYWEPKIKTYGIAEKTGLSMVSFYLLTEELGRGEGRLRRAGSAAGDLLLVFARPSAQGGLRLHLLFQGRPTWHLLAEFSGATGGGKPSGLRVDADVELIYFQGPHFGDRYGIADAAFGALLEAQVPVLAAACTGASIYIVLPKDTAAAARKALSDGFIVPGKQGCHERTDQKGNRLADAGVRLAIVSDPDPAAGSNHRFGQSDFSE